MHDPISFLKKRNALSITETGEPHPALMKPQPDDR